MSQILELYNFHKGHENAEDKKLASDADDAKKVRKVFHILERKNLSEYKRISTIFDKNFTVMWWLICQQGRHPFESA